MNPADYIHILEEKVKNLEAQVVYQELENIELRKKIDRMRGNFVKRRCKAAIVRRWYHYGPEGLPQCSF